MKIHTIMKNIGMAVDANGMLYTLREERQYNENDELIMHYDNEEVWYSINRYYKDGMPAGVTAFGPDYKRACAYLRYKSVNNQYHIPA